MVMAARWGPLLNSVYSAVRKKPLRYPDVLYLAQSR